MTKYVLFLLLSVALCAGGVHEHMNDVIGLCLIASVFFTLKIMHRTTKKYRKNISRQQASAPGADNFLLQV